MTREALLAGLLVSTFEIDHGFAEFVRSAYGEVPGFELFEGDFVKTWNKALAASGAPALAFGNLPYNAAGAIVAALIEGGVRPPRMVFTVQKESAQRMAARPGSKNYSAFSVLCTSMYEVHAAFDLSAGSFWPQPRVTSTVVVMTKRSSPVPYAGDRAFTGFTRACFSSRRKTLRNNLKSAGHDDASIADACMTVRLSPDARAETLAPEQLSALYSTLARLPDSSV